MVEGACERMMAATADDFMPLYTPAAVVWGFLFGRVLCCIYIYAHFCSIHFFGFRFKKLPLSVDSFIYFEFEIYGRVI